MIKIKTGIAGLDDMLSGGIPELHCVAVLGEFGTGKTTLALQFIWEGLKHGEKAIYISLEEDADEIQKGAAEFGWNLQKYIESKNLLIIKLNPEEAFVTIERINTELPEEIKAFGAKRVCIDSISLLGLLYSNEYDKRKALFSLVKAIKDSGATSLLTAEADPTNPSSSREGLIEYIVDGVILLKYEKKGDELRLYMSVLKMRRSAHSRKIRPYYITDEGIEVLSGTEAY